MKEILYFITPKIPGEPTFPLTRDPLPLNAIEDILTMRMAELKIQGYWRNCRGEKVPLTKVSFLIEPFDDEELSGRNS